MDSNSKVFRIIHDDFWIASAFTETGFGAYMHDQIQQYVLDRANDYHYSTCLVSVWFRVLAMYANDQFDETSENQVIWDFLREWRAFNSYVYFFGNESYCKIGVSVRPYRRMEELTTGAPPDVAPLCILPGNQKIEKALHKKFHHLRTRGEWFRLEGELQRFFVRSVALSGKIDLAHSKEIDSMISANEPQSALRKIRDS